MENYSIKDAFKSLKELDEKSVKLAYIPSLRESVAKDTCKQYLIESESFNVQNPADMAEAKNILDDNDDPEKLEQVVDVDANVKDDLKPSYKGQCLLQCPKCKTIMYKSPDDLEKSGETYGDDNGVEQYYYNVGTACPHCGEKETGFKLVGQVADPQINTEVDQESQNPLDMSAEEEQEHALDFDDLDSLANEEGDEFQNDLGEELPEEENEEPVFQESLKKKLKEDIEEEPCEECKQAGLTTVISDLIKDEWEAIDGYKSSVSTFKDQGQDPNVIKVFEDIIAEEMKHVGQLEAALKGIAPESENIAKGNEEGEQQLAGNEIDLPIEESLNEAEEMLDADSILAELNNKTNLEWTLDEEWSNPSWMISFDAKKGSFEMLVMCFSKNSHRPNEYEIRLYPKGFPTAAKRVKKFDTVIDSINRLFPSNTNESLNEASTFNKLMAAAEALPEENIEQKPEGEELREGPVDKDILAVNDAAKALNIHVKEAWHEAKFDFENDTEIDPPSDDVKPAKFDFENDEEVDVFDKPGTFYDKDGNKINVEEEIDLDDIDEESLDEQLSKYLKEQIETFESYKTTNASLDEELGKLFVEGCVKESDGSESKAEFEFDVKDFDKENNKLRFTEATENITLTTSLKEKMLVTESLE